MSSPLVFIDANVFLGCYARNHANYRQLLNSLLAIADKIIITNIVRDEFNRNRAHAYVTQNKVNPTKFGTPDLYHHHQVSGDDECAAKIKAARKLISEKQNEIIDTMREVHEKNVESIVDGHDDVSQVMAKLFLQAVAPAGDQLERARIRRELGNPPGKFNDPLGDQLSWEQVLDAARDKSSIWIVSNDRDYHLQAEGRLFLNPFLRDELITLNSKLEIHVFDNLASFLEAFTKAGYVPESAAKTAPIEEAKKEYEASLTERLVIGDTVTALVIRACPNTSDGQHDWDDALIPKPSQYGGWSYWRFCKRCGARYDTGEPYED